MVKKKYRTCWKSDKSNNAKSKDEVVKEKRYYDHIVEGFLSKIQ